MFFRNDAFLHDESNWDGLISQLFTTAKTLLKRFESEVLFILVCLFHKIRCAPLAFLSPGGLCIVNFVLLVHRSN